MITVVLVANLLALAPAVAELREAQRHRAQAEAAGATASGLRSGTAPDLFPVSRMGRVPAVGWINFVRCLGKDEVGGSK